VLVQPADLAYRDGTFDRPSRGRPVGPHAGRL